MKLGLLKVLVLQVLQDFEPYTQQGKGVGVATPTGHMHFVFVRQMT